MRHRVLSLILALLGACTRPEVGGGVRQLTLTPETRWVSAEEGSEAFAEVRAFAVDRGGRVYILDGQSQLVQLFDATGAHVRTIGRKGSGPGEFNQANGLALDAEDRLWVYDHGNARISVFDTAGKLVTSHPLIIKMYGWTWDGGLDRQGRLLDNIYTPLGGDSGRSEIARIDLAAATAETLPIPRCKAEPAAAYRFPRGMMGVPYTTRPYYKLDPAGFTWCGDTRHAAIAQYNLGDTIPFRQFGVTLEPAEVTPAARDSAVQRVKEFAKQVGSAEVDLTLIPKTKPLLQRVDLDDTGRLWMQVEEKRGQRFLVFDSTGAQVAEAASPPGMVFWLPLIVRGDVLYAAGRDSLDVQNVVRYRVR